MRERRFLTFVLLFLLIINTISICVPLPVFAPNEKSLSSNLKSAVPGTVIKMKEKIYWGKFEINTKFGAILRSFSHLGLPICPIVLVGNQATIQGTETEENDTCFTCTRANWWVMKDLNFRMCETGMRMISSNNNKIFNFVFRDQSHAGFVLESGKENMLSGFKFQYLGAWYNPWANGAVFKADQITTATGFQFGPKVNGYGVVIEKTSTAGVFTGATFNAVDKMILIEGMAWDVSGNKGTTSDGAGIVAGLQFGQNAVGNCASGNQITFTEIGKLDNGEGGGRGGSIGASGVKISPDCGAKGNLLCATTIVIDGNEDDTPRAPC